MMPLHSYFRCERCREVIDVFLTSYGEKATCFRCDIRWTRIRGDAYWVDERR